MKTNAVIQATFLGVDDKAYKREQRDTHLLASAKLTAVNQPIPAGPCCARCLNWTPPYLKTPYGECNVLSVLTRNAKNGSDRDGVVVYPERGEIVAHDEADDCAWETVPLPTGAQFAGCSLFICKESHQ